MCIGLQPKISVDFYYSYPFSYSFRLVRVLFWGKTRKEHAETQSPPPAAASGIIQEKLPPPGRFCATGYFLPLWWSHVLLFLSPHPKCVMSLWHPPFPRLICDRQTNLFTHQFTVGNLFWTNGERKLKWPDSRRMFLYSLGSMQERLRGSPKGAHRPLFTVCLIRLEHEFSCVCLSLIPALVDEDCRSEQGRRSCVLQGSL